jgi:hypothetical protein
MRCTASICSPQDQSQCCCASGTTSFIIPLVDASTDESINSLQRVFLPHLASNSPDVARVPRQLFLRLDLTKVEQRAVERGKNGDDLTLTCKLGRISGSALRSDFAFD